MNSSKLVNANPATTASAQSRNPVTASTARSPDTRVRLGICTYSCNAHWRAAREGLPEAQYRDVSGFARYCRSLGAGGIQVAAGTSDLEAAAGLRIQLEALGIYFEGQAVLPRDEGDLDRFEAEIRASKEAGAAVVRVACLSGRRYESFATAEAFREFAARSRRSLERVEPIVRKHDIRLAVENHKDWHADEFVELLRDLGSEHVGACIDTGNNLALLEDPLLVIEALAPFAMTTHLKDMAVAAHESGFLLSEVPLGDGLLDLPRIVGFLRSANPEIRFNLEMITRDPLVIPCLEERYWTTMADLPARHLAAAIGRVRRNPPRTPLPRIAGLDLGQVLALEERHIRESFAYAREHLGL